MIDPPSSEVVAGIHALIVGALLLGFGFLLASATIGRWAPGAAIRLALALPCVFVFALLLMLGHLAAGGRVLSNPLLVRSITVLSALIAGADLVRRRRREADANAGEGRPRRVEALIVGGAVLAALALWTIPVFTMLPTDHTGDMSLHTGWASQLMNGETSPSAPVTGDVPNYYPWLFHALLAFIARWVPGGTAFHATGPAQVIQPLGAVLALLALGRELWDRRSAAAGTALFGALTGGLGYFLLDKGPDVVLNPRGSGGRAGLRYMGDLFFNRPYSFSFNNLSPAYPRDLTFAMLPAFVLLLVLAYKRGQARYLLGAGVLLGGFGVTHLDAFVVGGAIGLFAVALCGEIGRIKAFASLFAPAAAIFAVWFAPVVASYLRIGPFANLAYAPVVLPAPAILVAWGVMTPFALVGAVAVVVGARSLGARIAICALAGSGSMLALSALVPRFLGEGFTTLGFQHRYWPMVNLAVALFAGLGAAEVWERLAGRSLLAAVAAAALVVALAVPSPVIAGLALRDGLYPKPRLRPLLTGALQGDPDNVLNVLKRFEGRCVAAAPHWLSFRAFSYVGFRWVLFLRLVQQEDLVERAAPIPEPFSFAGRGGNFPAIRWRQIYRSIPADPERVEANERLMAADMPAEDYRALADRWGVDLVVVPADAAERPAFDDLAKTEAEPVDGREVTVISLGPCGA